MEAGSLEPAIMPKLKLRPPSGIQAVMRHVIALLVMTVGASLHAQAPSAGGAIIGRVVDVDSGEPVPGARVAIADVAGGRTMTGGSDSYEVVADSQGRFYFSGLRPGLRSISTRTTENNIVDRPSPSVHVQLGPNQIVRDVVVSIVRSAWISGRVTDEAGDPVVGVYVSAYVRTNPETQPAIVAMRSSLTDDRGDYLLDPLMPGEYLVCACQWTAPLMDAGLTHTRSLLQPSTRNSEVAVQADVHWRPPVRTFHPSAGHPEDAAIIALRSNESRTDVHIGVVSSRLSNVSGKVFGLWGSLPSTAIRLRPVVSKIGAVSVEMEPVAVGPDGTFRFADIPPGNYVLLVRYRGPGPSTRVENSLAKLLGVRPARVVPAAQNAIGLWSATTVALDGRDVTDLHITVSPALRVSGVVRYSDKGAVEPLRANGGMLERLDEPVDELGVSSSVRADDDGGFELDGIIPGRYRFRWTILPPGLSLGSVRFGGRDVTDLPFVIEEGASATFDITLVPNDGGTVRGRVVSAVTASLTGIVAFPAERRFWEEPFVATRRFTHTTTDQLGQFALDELPPGEYIVAAIGPDDARSAWRTLARLEALAAVGTRVTVVPGDNPPVEIRR